LDSPQIHRLHRLRKP